MSLELSVEDVRSVRRALDEISWTYFDDVGADESSVRIDTFNRFIVEGYDSFVSHTLVRMLTNIRIPVKGYGHIVFEDICVETPMSPVNKKEFMWASDARGHFTYEADVKVTPFIVHGENSNKPFGTREKLSSPSGNKLTFFKIPIMIGSSLDAAMKYQNEPPEKRRQILAKHQVCFQDPAGYFIVKGTERIVITQNYLKTKRPLCVARTKKKDITICYINSMRPDWVTSRHEVFRMPATRGAIDETDRRIYAFCPIVRRNLRGPEVKPNASGQITGPNKIVGINSLHFWRLYVIYVTAYAPENFNPASSDTVNYYYENTYSAEEAEPDQRGSGIVRMHEDGSVYYESTYQMAVDEYKSYLLAHAGPEMFDKIQIYFEDTIKEGNVGETEEDFWLEMVKMNTSVANKGSKTITQYDMFWEDWTHHFLPHCSEESFLIKHQNLLNMYKNWKRNPGLIANIYTLWAQIEEELISRMNVLTFMTVKMLLCDLGFSQLDNKDAYPNINFRGAGQMIATRIAALLGRFRQNFGEIEFPTNHPSKIRETLESEGSSISTGLEESFSSGEWSDKGVENARTGNTDKFDRKTLQASLAQLRKTAVPFRGGRTVIEPRLLQPGSLGAICLSETPEGGPCGLLRHLAAAARISNDSNINRTLEAIIRAGQTEGRKSPLFKGLRKISNPETVGCRVPVSNNPALNVIRGFINEGTIHSDSSPDAFTPLFLDGKFFGFCSGSVVRDRLVDARRKGQIHPDTEITYTNSFTQVGRRSELKIETEGGRIMQPLLIIHELPVMKRLIDKLIAYDRGLIKLTILDLFADGFVEYIGTSELSTIRMTESIDIYLNVAMDGMEDRFTHCLLNPSFSLGISANIMPYLDTNPSVRNSYFSAMSKQPDSVSIPVEWPVKDVGFLPQAEKPIITTKMFDRLFHENPFGANLKILLTPYPGNEEDAVIINQRVSDSGVLSSINNDYAVAEVKTGREFGFGPETWKKMEGHDRYGRGVIREKTEVIREIDPDLDEEARKEVEGLVLIRRELARQLEGIIEDKHRTSPHFDNFEAFKAHAEQYDEEIALQKERIAEVSRQIQAKIDEAPKQFRTEIQNTRIKPGEILAQLGWSSGSAREFENLKQERLRDGVVKKVIWDVRNETSRKLWVVMTYEDKLGIGDKLASRHGQKGIIAGIIPDSDMPFDAVTGETPDIIMNPMALPSRMTAGQPFEMLISKVVVLPDKSQNYGFLVERYGFDVAVPLERLFIVDSEEWNIFDKPERKPTTPTILIPSDEVYDEDTMSWLKNHDIVRQHEDWSDGLWGIRLDRYNGRGWKLIRNLDKYPNLKAILREHKDVPSKQETKEPQLILLDGPDLEFEAIPNLWFDLETNEEGQRINPARGIRLSKLPEQYSKGFIKKYKTKPVTEQYILGYMPEFFIASNVIHFKLDFYIPEEEKYLTESKKELKSPFIISYKDEENQPQEYDISQHAEDGRVKYSNLLIVTLKATVYVKGAKDPKDPTKSVKPVLKVQTMTLAELWKDQFGGILIDGENIINLPSNPASIFENRMRRIQEFRDASSFRKTDIRSAMEELKLMGYNHEGTSSYINGKTGEVMQGEIFSGYVYYLPLKHKVKNKFQVRGPYGPNKFTKQPTQGRANSGGVKSGFMPSLMYHATDSQHLLMDRMLWNADKQTSQICKACGIFCYKIKGSSIVCPKCQDADVYTVVTPYVLERMINYGMAAGIGIQLNTEEARQELPE